MATQTLKLNVKSGEKDGKNFWDRCGVLFVNAYSGVIRPVIPKVSGHPFRFYPASDSGASGHPVM